MKLLADAVRDAGKGVTVLPQDTATQLLALGAQMAFNELMLHLLEASIVQREVTANALLIDVTAQREALKALLEGK